MPPAKPSGELKYFVIARGHTPSDLARRVSQAHAAAIQSKWKKTQATPLSQIGPSDRWVKDSIGPHINAFTAMGRSMRKLHRLDLKLEQIIKAVRRHPQVIAGARELDCSNANIHVGLKQVALTLAQVLLVPDLRNLLHGQS